MAGSTLDYPLNGAANWEAFPDIVQKIQAGYMRIGLTNFDNNNEPQIAAGGTLDVNGTCCVFGAAESITGWAGIAISTDVYIKIVVTGAVVTAEFTTDAPTWDAAKQGWYDGNDRYIGGLYKDASGNYTLKWLYPENSGDPINQEMIREGQTRPLLEKEIEIGDWNMDANNVVTVNHGMGELFTRFRNMTASVRDDNDEYLSPLIASFDQTGGKMAGGIVYITSTLFRLGRTSGENFDSNLYDSTSFNRGWINFKLRA
jgi:hypothetical protein